MASSVRRLFKLFASTTAAAGCLGMFSWSNNRGHSEVSSLLLTAQAAFPFLFPVTIPWDWNWDKQSPLARTDGKAVTEGDKPDSYSSMVTEVPRYTRHLILIRHGQYIAAHDDADCTLTALGREQANFTGNRLAELNFPYDKLYYSTMTRAIETSEHILKLLPPGVPAEPCDQLREGAPYPVEPPLPNWSPSPESLQEDGARIEAAFRKHVHRAIPSQSHDTYELYVCHANVIRYFVCRALQFPPEAWIRFSLDHGSITWITVRPNGRVAVRYVGNSGHIPSDMITID